MNWARCVKLANFTFTYSPLRTQHIFNAFRTVYARAETLPAALAPAVSLVPFVPVFDAPTLQTISFLVPHTLLFDLSTAAVMRQYETLAIAHESSLIHRLIDSMMYHLVLSIRHIRASTQKFRYRHLF